MIRASSPGGRHHPVPSRPGGEHVSRGAELFTLVRFDVWNSRPRFRSPRQRCDARPAGAVSRRRQGLHGQGGPRQPDHRSRIALHHGVRADPQPRGELKGNTFSSGQIIAQTLNNVLVVPQPAVRTGQDGKQFVYRIVGGELEQAPVTVGAVDEARGLVEIRDGVRERDQVVVGNVGTLGRGMKAQIIGNERAGTPARAAAPSAACQRALSRTRPGVRASRAPTVPPRSRPRLRIREPGSRVRSARYRPSTIDYRLPQCFYQTSRSNAPSLPR